MKGKRGKKNNTVAEASQALRLHRQMVTHFEKNKETCMMLTELYKWIDVNLSEMIVNGMIEGGEK